MTEKQLQSCVVKLAKLLKLLVYHTHDSRRSEAGFPDLCIVGPHSMFFAELKSDKGRVSKAQLGWLSALEKAGCEVWVFRPFDWHSGAIEARLKAVACESTARRVA